MGADDLVLVDVEGDVASVTLNRPERRNALGSASARAVADAIEEAEKGCRVIVLTGAGPAFCAGGDLEELDRWSGMDPDEISNVLYGSFQQMIRSIRDSPAIVIAAVNGAAVGAGMDLALACDLRVASEEARFGQVWVRLGVIPGTGGAWLTHALVGPTKAAELLLTGELIDAPTALAYGLVNRVVSADALLDEAHSLATLILRHPRAGVVANKRALVAASDAGLAAALEHAAKVQPERFTSDEFRAAVAAALGRGAGS